MALCWCLFLEAISFYFFLLFSKSCGELITALPGQPINVSFKQYSGYIVTDAQHGRALFYYFVEADLSDPLSLPLTLWLSGGPGCSSLGIGAFMEHGPFQPGENGVLVKNKYSWNLASNMLYVESPIGVGFSYSNTSSDYIKWNDTRTAEDNLVFMVNWLNEFPQFRDSDLYLTGESYAGHYIPQLAALMVEYNKQPNITPIKLKAIALGNPLLDLDISVNAADYLWAHGAISDETLVLKKTVCNDSRYFREYAHDKLSKACVDVFNRVEEEIGVDLYDLLLPRCLSSRNVEQFITEGKHASIHATVNVDSFPGEVPMVIPALMVGYLPILTSLKFKMPFMPTQPITLSFGTSALGGPLKYQKDNIDMNVIPLVSDLLKDDIPIMLFSGDQDSRIPLTQTRIIANMIAKNLKFIPLTKYGNWYDKKQVGGWVQSFGALKDGKNLTYLTYATVRGAGHEVPFSSPSQALTLFQAFLSRSPLPTTPQT